VQLLKFSSKKTSSIHDNTSAAVQVGLVVADLLRNQGYPLWLTLQEVGEIVGVKDPKTIRKYCQKGVLPLPSKITKKFSLVEVVLAAAEMRGERHIYPLSVKDQVEVSQELTAIKEMLR